MKTLLRSLFLICGCGLPTLATAAVITFSYTATGIGPSTGATVTGQFGWDNAVADTEPLDDLGLYPAAGFWSGVISGGPQDGADFNLSGLDVTVSENQPTGGAPGEIFDGVGIPVSTESFIGLNDETGTVFSSDVLPATINLADFPGAGFALINVDIGLPPNPGVQSSYQFTSVTLIPVPAAVWLFGSALGLLGWMKRRAR